MNALVLGGQSSRHQAWVRDVASALTPQLNEVRFLDYRHWSDGSPNIDMEHEVAQAAALVEDFGDYVIVAKSIGSVIATFGTSQGVLQPTRCVILGFPMKIVMSELPDIEQALHSLPATIFVHNERDPLGDAAALREHLETNGPAEWQLITTPGDTHDYIDVAQIVRCATQQF